MIPEVEQNLHRIITNFYPFSSPEYYYDKIQFLPFLILSLTNKDILLALRQAN